MGNSLTSSLHPGDIIPFTRKPLFLIIESENSHVFQDITSPFGVPLVIFMSAPEVPSCIQGKVKATLYSQIYISAYD